MTYDEFNRFCENLPATHMVFQWGGCYVWKVGTKVFAIGGWEQEETAFTFKTSEIAYETLRNQAGLRPAPYFAARGMKWIQQYAQPGLNDGELKDLLIESHQLAAQNLTRKMRANLGLPNRSR